MTSKTTNYNLEKYDATDVPNLQGAYNNSMDIIDTQLKAQDNRISSIPTPESLPDGLKAFCTALGLTNSNSSALGTALNHFLNRTPASTDGNYTTANLANTKVTAEGLPFVAPSSTGE